MIAKPFGDWGRGAMTTQQKRHLGICGVGTIARYCDPVSDKCRKALVVNLSRITDKNSNACLEHLWHSLKHSPTQEFLSNKQSTQKLL